MELIKLLNWRYATKRMNKQKVPQQKVDNIIEAIRLSASSIGLQPYSLIVIEKDELKKQITKIANGQPQIEECSHLIVFAAWDNLTNERIDTWLNLVEKERGSIAERTLHFANYLRDKALHCPIDENFNWIAKQAYIALGTALIAAAAEGVDSTPIEGFKPDDLDTLLNLKEKGLRSVLILPLGFRDAENDFLVNQKKIRRAKNDFVITL